MSEIEKYYNGEIIVDFEEETELEKNYNEVAELYSKAVKKKIEYRKEIERLNNIINELEKENKQLKANWDKLKEYIRKNAIYDDVGMKILDPSLLEDYMQELEGSENNE